MVCFNGAKRFVSAAVLCGVLAAAYVAEIARGQAPAGSSAASADGGWKLPGATPPSSDTASGAAGGDTAGDSTPSGAAMSGGATGDSAAPGATLPNVADGGNAVDPILGDSSKAKIDPALPLAAQVGDTPIYQKDVDAALAKFGQRKLDPAALPSIQANILDQLITKTLLDKYLTAQKMTPTQKEVDAALVQLKENLKKQNNTGVLGRVDDAALRDFVAQQLGLRKFVAANQTDDTLRAVFKALHEQFDGTERRVSHILLRPEAGVDAAKVNALREEAVQLRDDITSGRTTFDAAAERYSAGPSRHQHGDLGYIPPQGVMMPEFSQVAFALKPGEISQPVLTAFGYHLIKVTDVKPGKKSFDDVKEAVKARFPDLLMRQITMLLKQKYGDKVVFNESYPHYKPGTTELANPTAMSGSP